MIVKRIIGKSNAIWNRRQIFEGQVRDLVFEDGKQFEDFLKLNIAEEVFENSETVNESSGFISEPEQVTEVGPGPGMYETVTREEGSDAEESENENTDNEDPDDSSDSVPEAESAGDSNESEDDSTKGIRKRKKVKITKRKSE